MTKLLDPVCGMTVDGDTALRAAGHADVAFCAPGCRTTFLEDPDAYPDRLEDADPELTESTSSEHDDHACQCGHGHDDHGHAEHSERASVPVAGGSGCCGGHGG